MFKFLIFLCLATVPVAILGQDSEEVATPYVTGGRNALVGEYASDCSITTPLQLHCQGILLNDRHILTVAQCVVNPENNALINPVQLRVTCGDNSLFVIGANRVVRSVSHIYPHNQYDSNTNNNDLAVLRLDTPIQLPHNTIEEAILQTRIVPQNADCQFSGWGAASNVSDVLNVEKRVISAPVVSRITCNNLANAGTILEPMLCAGLTVGTGPIAGPVAQAVCRGNIGGGLYCNGRVSGILSFGLGCGNPNQPGVYIQPRFYTTWINQQFTRTDTVAPGTTFPRP